MTHADPPRSHAAPLTVLIASGERGLYGGETQALLLAEGLRSRGHRPLLLAHTDGALRSRAAELGLETVPWKAGHGPRRLLATRRLVRQLSPDVLHCNDSGSLTAAAGVAIGLPIGATVASRRVAFPVRSPFAYRRLAGAVICVSEEVRAVCAAAGLPSQLLHVVPDGVDSDRLRAGDRRRGRESLDIDMQTTVVLTVASLHECKGHATLIDGLGPLLTERPGLHLVLAGAGPLRAQIAARAAASGAGKRVHVLGYRDDVPDLLAAADLFVLPSLQEGLGTALLEAMFAGLPCVASCVGGMPEALADGASPCGWLVPAGEPAPLAAAVRSVLDDPEEASRRARRAHARAEARFTADRMVEGTLTVYRKVLRRG